MRPKFNRLEYVLPLAAYGNFLAAQTGLAANRVSLVGSLPGKARAGASEMSERSGGPVNGPAQIQGFDDSARSQLEGRADQFGNFFVGNRAGAERFSHHRNGISEI